MGYNRPMVELQQIINQIFINKGLNPSLAVISISQRPDLADYQINGALSAAKVLKKSPEVIANEIISEIPKKFKDLIFFTNVKGFINLNLSDEYLLQGLQTSLSVPKSIETVCIDYSGPNVAKSMHVGHLRSTLIGNSLEKIYKYQGSKVTTDNHLGDFGTPLGIVVTKIIEQKDFSYTLSEIEKNYVKGAKQYKEDPIFKETVLKATVAIQNKQEPEFEVWQKVVGATIASLKDDYSKLNISFDLWQGESFYLNAISKMLKELKDKNLVQDSEGAAIVDLGLESPLILEKAKGGYLYHTSDLACLKDRLKNFDKVLYVVDSRQKLHFKQVFLAAEKFGWINSQVLSHVDFGTINGPDNKPFKTRDGGVLKLSDLISQAVEEASTKEVTLEDAEKIGIGALKFAELKHNRRSDYVFDLKKFMSNEGCTGPYLMYSLVRAKSLLVKNPEEAKLGEKVTSPEEKAVVLKLNQFVNAFTTSVSNNEPHHLCEYGFSLANAFNSFYVAHPLLKESNGSLKAHRLALVNHFIKTLEVVLSLLGIQVPEKM